MKDVSGEGRTVLFVSHNMNAVQELCNSIVFLEKGTISLDTKEVRKAIGLYFSNGSASNSTTTEWIDVQGDSYKNECHNITLFKLADETGQVLGQNITHNSTIHLIVEGVIFKEEPMLNIGYILYNEHNFPIFWSWARLDEAPAFSLDKAGKFRLETTIPSKFINEGTYRIELVSGITSVKWLLTPNTFEISLSFQIVGGHNTIVLNPQFNWNYHQIS